MGNKRAGRDKVIAIAPFNSFSIDEQSGKCIFAHLTAGTRGALVNAAFSCRWAGQGTVITSVFQLSFLDLADRMQDVEARETEESGWWGARPIEVKPFQGNLKIQPDAIA